MKGGMVSCAVCKRNTREKKVYIRNEILTLPSLPTPGSSYANFANEDTTVPNRSKPLTESPFPIFIAMQRGISIKNYDCRNLDHQIR